MTVAYFLGTKRYCRLRSRQKVYRARAVRLIVAAAVLLYFLSVWLPFLAQAKDTKFWHDCQQVTSAAPDNYLHFICTDYRSRKWEVLVRQLK